MKTFNRLVFICCIVIISACTAPIVGNSPTLSQTPDYAIVKVMYATDRNYNEATVPNNAYGNKRATLSYGISEVSIPHHHIIGILEEPSLFKLEFKESPEKHVALLGVKPLAKENFFTQLSSDVGHTEQSKAFLFVHGYNVSFADAARRTAQIYYDLKIDMVPVFYSWPSQSKTVSYTVDEQNIEWTQNNLKNFLIDFLEKSSAHNIYLIAHSMGNRALTRAVIDVINTKPDYRARIKEVILAAPDIDADVFKRDIAPALTASGGPVTLYASSVDKALIASQKIHQYPRAGDARNGLIYYPGIESIDATNVDTSFVGHSYPAEERSVLSDIFYLINADLRAKERFGLSYVETGKYWEFKP